MKPIFTLLLVLLASASFSQKSPFDSTRHRGKKNGYGSITFQAGFTSGNNSLGGAFNFGARPGKVLGVGLGFEMLKFKNVKTNYIPAYLDLRFFLPTNSIETFIMVQPGYGFYNFNDDYEDTIANTISSIKQTGGFYLSSGIGAKISGKISPIITLRYARYAFNTTLRGNHFAADAPGNISSIVLNVGIGF